MLLVSGKYSATALSVEALAVAITVHVLGASPVGNYVVCLSPRINPSAHPWCDCPLRSPVAQVGWDLRTTTHFWLVIPAASVPLDLYVDTSASPQTLPVEVESTRTGTGSGAVGSASDATGSRTAVSGSVAGLDQPRHIRNQPQLGYVISLR